MDFAVFADHNVKLKESEKCHSSEKLSANADVKNSKGVNNNNNNNNNEMHKTMRK